MTLTPELIARLKELEQRATPGDWHVHRPRLNHYIRSDDGIFVMEQTQHGVRQEGDAELIAASRNALPELLKRAEAIDRLLDWLKCERIAAPTPADTDAETLAYDRAISRAQQKVLALLADQQEG